IGELIDSTIMQLLPVSFAKELVSTLMGGTPAPEAVEPAYTPEPPAPAAAPPQSAPAYTPPASPPQPAYMPPMPEQPAAMPAMPAMQPSGPQTIGNVPVRNVNVQPVQFANFQGAPYIQADETNLNLLLDI